MKKTILSLLVVSSLLVAACGQAPKKAADTETEVEAVVEEAIDEVTAATDSIVAEAAEIVEQAAE